MAAVVQEYSHIIGTWKQTMRFPLYTTRVTSGCAICTVIHHLGTITSGIGTIYKCSVPAIGLDTVVDGGEESRISQQIQTVRCKLVAVTAVTMKAAGRGPSWYSGRMTGTGVMCKSTSTN